jgi:hypothetical protein
MLEHWHDFYLLVGTAASALLALLFVAVSIGAGVLSRDRSGPRSRSFPSIRRPRSASCSAAAPASARSTRLLSLAGSCRTASPMCRIVWPMG